MSRLTFDDLTPDDMPRARVDDWGARADAYRDSLADLIPSGKQRTATMPMRTVDGMLALRPSHSKIEHDEEHARTLRDLADILDDLLYDKDVDWLNDEQLASLWCDDVPDTFNMLDDFVARLGLDEGEVDHIKETLYDMLPAEAQRDLVAMQIYVPA